MTAVWLLVAAVAAVIGLVVYDSASASAATSAPPAPGPGLPPASPQAVQVLAPQRGYLLSIFASREITAGDIAGDFQVFPGFLVLGALPTLVRQNVPLPGSPRADGGGAQLVNEWALAVLYTATAATSFQDARGLEHVDAQGNLHLPIVGTQAVIQDARELLPSR